MASTSLLLFISFILFFSYSFLDLSLRIQSLAAQHGSTLLALEQLEYTIAHYTLLLDNLARDFLIMFCQNSKADLVKFGLAANEAVLEEFESFLKDLRLGTDDGWLSDRLAYAQSTYENLIRFLNRGHGFGLVPAAPSISLSAPTAPPPALPIHHSTHPHDSRVVHLTPDKRQALIDHERWTAMFPGPSSGSAGVHRNPTMDRNRSTVPIAGPSTGLASVHQNPTA